MEAQSQASLSLICSSLWMFLNLEQDSSLDLKRFKLSFSSNVLHELRSSPDGSEEISQQTSEGHEV